MIHYFMGVDAREKLAADVAKYSAQKYSNEKIIFHDIEHRTLRAQGIFDRPWRINGDGTMVDLVDNLPFSTEFSHSRFLVPYLARKMGIKGKVLFTDCDWLWQGPVEEIFKEANNSAKALWVVPHDYKPSGDTKMDNQPQAKYSRKLWSALMIFDVSHYLNDVIADIEVVNRWSGSDLHKLKWLPDNAIGYLDEKWHWLPGISPTTKEYSNESFGYHFTLGIPDDSMTHRIATSQDILWHNEYMSMLKEKYN